MSVAFDHCPLARRRVIYPTRQPVRITNVEHANLHDSRVVTCRVRGCRDRCSILSMLDQLVKLPLFYHAALNSHPRFFHPSCGHRCHHASERYVSFFSPSNFEAPLASAESHNSTAPHLIGVFSFAVSADCWRGSINDLCHACQTKAGVPASAGLFRCKIGRATPLSVGASAESCRFYFRCPYVSRVSKSISRQPKSAALARCLVVTLQRQRAVFLCFANAIILYHRFMSIISSSC